MSIPYSFNPLGSTQGSGTTGMYLDGTALKGLLCNTVSARTVGEGADGSALTDGTRMFYTCSKLTSWTVDLPNLQNGHGMFYQCSNLTQWTVDLPNLTNGEYMFFECQKLTSLTTALPNLQNGNSMFHRCSSMTSFNAGAEGLKSLTDGTYMFSECNLYETSVLHILNTIPTYTSGNHALHLGNNNNWATSTTIAGLLGTTVPIATGSSYKYKGWTITILKAKG